MKLKFIALILGVVFGGYVVVQHGPPQLRERLLNLFSLVYDVFPGKAEEKLPDEPAARAQVLIKKLDTNLYEIGNLAKIVEDKNKKFDEKKSEALSGAKTPSNATSTAVQTPQAEKPKTFLENLFTPTDPKPEEKLQKVIEETKKIVTDLEATNQRLREEIRQLGSSTTSGGGSLPSSNQAGTSQAATPLAPSNQTSCACEAKK